MMGSAYLGKQFSELGSKFWRIYAKRHTIPMPESSSVKWKIMQVIETCVNHVTGQSVFFTHLVCNTQLYKVVQGSNESSLKVVCFGLQTELFMHSVILQSGG